MDGLMNWLNGKKTMLGLAALVAMELNKTGGWIALDPNMSAYLNTMAMGLMGWGATHKLSKLEKKKA